MRFKHALSVFSHAERKKTRTIRGGTVERLGSLGIMGAQLRASLTLLEHHNAMVLSGLRGSFIPFIGSHLFYAGPYLKNLKRSSERLTFLGIMGAQLKPPPKPLNTIEP